MIVFGESHLRSRSPGLHTAHVVERPEPAKKREVRAKMRRAFDDLDMDVYKAKRERRHRRQRLIRALRKGAGICASCGGSLVGAEGCTCVWCLSVDGAYKRERPMVEATAQYIDEFARPMKLRFTPKMLPVIGPRYDGDEADWPPCRNLSTCLTEVIAACGAKDPPGARCPRGCSHFIAAKVDG